MKTLLLLLISFSSFAQCAFTVQPNEWKFDAKAKGVKAGDIICIASGVRSELLFDTGWRSIIQNL